MKGVEKEIEMIEGKIELVNALLQRLYIDGIIEQEKAMEYLEKYISNNLELELDE